MLDNTRWVPVARPIGPDCKSGAQASLVQIQYPPQSDIASGMTPAGRATADRREDEMASSHSNAPSEERPADWRRHRVRNPAAGSPRVRVQLSLFPHEPAPARIRSALWTQQGHHALPVWDRERAANTAALTLHSSRRGTPPPGNRRARSALPARPCGGGRLTSTKTWAAGRAAECASLENWSGRKSIVGSNPTPPATCSSR